MRLIDADKLIKKLCEQETALMRKGIALVKGEHSVFEIINSQPTVNEWIPVSEEPKEERTDVLAVLEHCDSKTIKIEVIEWSYDEWKVNWNWNILAWMPIPEYKEQ